MPDDPEAIREEISRNREIITELCGNIPHHFCYPSGNWKKSHLNVLSELQIQSATTCDVGENRRTTHPLILSRFLDRDDLSDLEFEAEISGFKPLLRRVTRRGTHQDR
jgi:hypothetical protein